MFFQHCIIVKQMFCVCWESHLTRGVDSALAQCWASVVDDGPTLSQRRINISCLVLCSVIMGFIAGRLITFVQVRSGQSVQVRDSIEQLVES